MKALVCDPVLGRFMEVLRAGCREVDWMYREPGDEAGILKAVGDTDVFVGSRFTPEMAQAAPALRFVQVSGAGTDKIAPSVSAGDRGIVVANVFGHEESIAEHVLMVVLALSRQLLVTDRALRRGYWRNAAMHPSLPLHQTLRGKTVGLVGYGHIGRRVEAMVKPLGMDAIAIRGSAGASTAPDGPVLGGPDRLSELLSRSDYVVVVVPLTSVTTGMIGAAELALMKPTSCLVNVSRGPVVDEDALYDALMTEQIAGCALDVWYRPGQRFPDTGPPGNRPFEKLDNVLMTPHVSAVTEDTFLTRARAVAENVNRFAQGLVPHNLVPDAQKEHR